MKRLIFIFCVFCTTSSYCQDITKIEYSIDKFVAEGNGILLSVSDTSSFDSFLDIDISELSDGLHTILFRSQNSDGKWSLPMQISFYVSNPDTVTVEKIFYRFYNTTYNGEWKELLVMPTRKKVDSLFAVSTTGLNMDEQYSMEFYAVNSNGVRGHSAYLSNIELVPNSGPETLMSELNINMQTGSMLQVSMDSLFSDIDVPNGDSLAFDLVDISDVQLNDFTTWSSNKLIQFEPISGHAKTYTFNISATDTGNKTATVEVTLIVDIPTGIESRNLNSIDIYPNPAKDFLSLKNLDNVDNLEVRILNINGKTVFSKTVNDSRIDISNLTSGIYFIKICTEDYCTTKKFVVQ